MTKWQQIFKLQFRIEKSVHSGTQELQNQLSVKNAYKRYSAQIRYTPALALYFPLPVAATLAQ